MTVPIYLIKGLVWFLTAGTVTAANIWHYRFRQKRLRQALEKSREGNSEESLREMYDYLQTLREKYLRPGERLDIELVQLERAGSVKHYHPDKADLLISSDNVPAVIRMRYSLTKDGAAVSSGEIPGIYWLLRKLAEDCITSSVADSEIDTDKGDALNVEKHLLDGWFRKRLRTP